MVSSALMGGGHSDPMRGSWPSFLRGESAAQVLARLSNGDPLRLAEVSARRLREVWLLLEPDRVCRRAYAVCAEASQADEPPGDLASWTLAKVDLAIEQLAREDREAERFNPEQLSREDKDFPLLTRCLFLEPELVRRCTVAFNQLDAQPRRAFFELLLDGRDVRDIIEGGPWNADGLYVAIHTALAVFGLDMPLETAGKDATSKEHQS
jgi:hypothetical protein